MKRNEWYAFERLIDDYDDVLSNRGCNDTDEEILAAFTSKELSELSKDYHILNGDPEEWSEGDYSAMLQDHCLLFVLMGKVKKELFSGEQL